MTAIQLKKFNKEFKSILEDMRFIRQAYNIRMELYHLEYSEDYFKEKYFDCHEELINRKAFDRLIAFINLYRKKYLKNDDMISFWFCMREVSDFYYEYITIKNPYSDPIEKEGYYQWTKKIARAEL